MSLPLHSFSLADMVREQAANLPAAPAVVLPEETLTYAEMDARSRLLAEQVRAAGIGPGARVVWHGPDDQRFLLALLAVARVGAHLLPLNWRCTDQELEGLLRRAEPDLVLTAPSPRATPPDLTVTGCPVIDIEDGNVVPEAARTWSVLAPEPVIDDELPVLAFFTAAFSGEPEIAQVSHRAIVTQSLVMGALGEVDATHEIYLASGPMFHMGVLLKLLANYLFGNPVVLAASGRPEEVCELIERHRVTSAYLFRPSVDRIVELNADRRWDLSTLAMIPDTPSKTAHDRWHAMTSCPAREASWAMGYGQTETWGMAIYSARGPATSARFGRPSPVAAVGILDGDGFAVERGEPGEIVVRGPQVMTGYDGREPEGEWHRTGDTGIRRPDGGVDFLGPIRALIKTGMENVYPAEVESVLGDHASVVAACVVGIPDPVWGESVCAAVVVTDPASTNENDLIAHVKSRIASYKKPRRVLFLDALPTGPGGVDREAVRELFDPASSETNPRPNEARSTHASR